MRKSKPMIMLVVSVAVGLAATAAASKYMSKQPTGEPEPKEPVSKFVVVAKQKIAEGKAVVAFDVKKEEKLIAELAEDAIEKVDGVLGRKALMEIEEGSVVSESMLDEKRVILDLKPGMRKMSVYDANVPARLKAGMFVDVISVDEEKENDGIGSGIILEHIRVLEVPEADRRSRGVPKASLELAPSDAVTLVRATQRGPITLIGNFEEDAPKPRKKTIVAAIGIASGHRITNADLKVARVCVDRLPDGRYIDAQEAAIDMETTTEINAGDVILAEHLRRPVVVKMPAPSDLLAQAKTDLANGRDVAAEKALEQLVQMTPGSPEAEEARAIVKSITERKRRRTALRNFAVINKLIGAMIAEGQYAEAEKKIEDAYDAFGGIETEEGQPVEDILMAHSDEIKEIEKQVKRLETKYKFFMANGRDDLAKKYLKELRELCPRGDFAETVGKAQP